MKRIKAETVPDLRRDSPAPPQNIRSPRNLKQDKNKGSPPLRFRVKTQNTKGQKKTRERVREETQITFKDDYAESLLLSSSNGSSKIEKRCGQDAKSKRLPT